MNCARCTLPALVLFPGGYCGKCNAILSAPVAFAPKKRKPKRLPEACEGERIKHEKTDRCKHCGHVKERKEGEKLAHYLLRRYCAAHRTCYRDAQRERAHEHQPWNGNKKTTQEETT